jgi:hypothetical protein
MEPAWEGPWQPAILVALPSPNRMLMEVKRQVDVAREADNQLHPSGEVFRSVSGTGQRARAPRGRSLTPARYATTCGDTTARGANSWPSWGVSPNRLKSRPGWEQARRRQER